MVEVLRAIRLEPFMRNLVNFKELDVENQSAIGWNSRQCLLAIGKIGWDSDSSLAANGHASDTNIPTLDDLASAKFEREGLSTLVCYYSCQ